MGIDRIGKQGPAAPAPSTETGTPARPTQSERTFEVSRPASAATPPQVQGMSAPATALERVRSGEIDVHDYVEQKVHEATAHLGKLSAAKLEAIRGVLRERMSTDPTLVDLLRTAAGQVPEPPRDE